LANKIFTTFTKKEDLQATLDKIRANYTILYSKIFVFSSPQTEELICTYNIDSINCTSDHIIENTVLLHRKKASRTLFSINAVNILNEQLAKEDPNHVDINWELYKESILLTRKGVFCQLHIKLYDIIYTNKENISVLIK
jgi:hypothetical protein